MSSPDWSKMPQDLVIKSFSYLKENKDKAAAALACKNWWEAFQSPSVWKTLDLVYESEDADGTEKKTMAFVKSKYIRYLKSLDFCIQIDDIQPVARFLIEFFSCMTEKTQLNTFKLEFLDDLDQLKFVDRARLLDTFVQFFKAQKSLKVLTFEDSNVGSYEGFKILGAAIKNCEVTLEVLDIQGFIDHKDPLYQCPEFMNIMASLRNLRKLGIPYYDINGEVLQLLATNFGPKLECLHIAAHFIASHTRTPTNAICRDDWTDFKRRCVNAKVKLDSFGNHNLSLLALIPFLILDMPLEELDCIFGKDGDLSFFLKYLGTHFSETLKFVFLKSFDMEPSLEEALDFLFQRCTKLEYFYACVKKDKSEDFKNKVKEIFSKSNIQGLDFEE